MTAYMPGRPGQGRPSDATDVQRIGGALSNDDLRKLERRFLRETLLEAEYVDGGLGFSNLIVKREDAPAVVAISAHPDEPANILSMWESAAAFNGTGADGALAYLRLPYDASELDIVQLVRGMLVLARYGALDVITEGNR